MSYLPSNPGLNKLSSLFAKYPRRGIWLFKLFEHVTHGNSPLPRENRVLLSAFISRLNGCEFCYHAYLKKAAEAGIDLSKLDEIQANMDGTDGDKPLVPLLGYLQKLTLTPELISEKDSGCVFAAGWDEAEFLEAVYLCASVTCINRLVMGIGIKAEKPSTTYRPFQSTGYSFQPIMGQTPWTH